MHKALKKAGIQFIAKNSGGPGFGSVTELQMALDRFPSLGTRLRTSKALLHCCPAPRPSVTDSKPKLDIGMSDRRL